MPAIHSRLRLEIRPDNPKIYFLVFLTSNILLSYFPFSLGAKLWIGLFGLVLPWVFALRYSSKTDAAELLQKDFLTPVSAWVWGLMGAAAVLIRFYKLTSLSTWPLYDEGMYGYYAAQLSRRWDWQFFYGPSQAPPLYLWLEAIVFKVGGVSLFTIWFLPALISSLLFPTAYWAARGLFPRSMSFLLAGLFGFSFWPVYVGRFSLMTGLVLLVECLVLGALARCLSETSSNRLFWKAVFLGALLGLGFYTYLHWPVLAVLVGLTFLFFILGEGRSPRFPGFKIFTGFLLAFVGVLLPFSLGVFREGIGQFLFYLNHLSAATHALSWKNQAAVSISYLSSLFWGMDLKYHTYQPVWGGYLNPVLDSLFLLGLVEALRRRREKFCLWLLAGLVLFTLPGVLTSERATSRMILVFPVLAVMIALGWRRLWGEKSRSRRFSLLLALSVLSIALDGYHLAYAYPKVWKNLD